MKRVLAGIAVTAAALSFSGGIAQADAHENQVTLMHGIPGVTVDVSVGGEVLLPAFEPGDTADLTPFAGLTLTDIVVYAAGTEDIAIGPIAELTVPSSGNWTVLAHLDADGAPTITPFQNNVAPTAAGEGRLTVRHTAAAPAVDLVVGDARPIEGAENGASAELLLPAGEIAGAQLAPAGGDPIVDVPAVTLAAGSNLIVYAVGSLAGETFTFYTQEIMVGAAAPVAVNTGAPIDDEAMTMVVVLAMGAFVLAVGGLTVARRAALARVES